MCRIWSFILIVFLTVPASLASAAYEEPNLDPVRFKLLDSDNDKKVKLSLFNLPTSHFENYSLQYRLGKNGGFNDWAAAPKDGFDVFDEEFMSFQLSGPSGETFSRGDLTFLKGGGLSSDKNKLWSVFVIDWGTPEKKLTLGFAKAQELTSAAPIPAAAWILGAGLLGVIGLRRYTRK